MGYNAGGYRYGFNGQEKSSEIGDNNYTAQFWEYDSRIGRRWNIDAVYKHSSYEAFAGNPISYADPSGLDTFNFNRRVTTYYPSNGGRPTGTSTFDITQVRSGGADVFMYNQTNTIIDSRGGRTTTTRTVLHPEDRESAVGMTKGRNLYFDGLITTERNNYDWESIGKLMYANAGFKSEMLSRNPKSAEWMSNASSMEVMEGLLPVATQIGTLEYSIFSISAFNKGFSINNGAGGLTRPMKIERYIYQGEKLEDLIETAQLRTFNTGLEHAIVRLSSGEKALVSGGPHGIFFRAGEIKTLFGHTHPVITGASAGDLNALIYLNQSKQYIFEAFNKTPIILRK
ncbi:hypothetical protein [Chitinophaga sp. S165]|uniref:hypothetical protein n=1 Tax=Chitinophaga sp. S165 TaxID=2135462 RepID=UPI000D70BD6F|nr:hypothetical protein [Chitinophaga sp. S165]PWV55754.1 hypothetical protein C7475_101261 [Chitinophaga sp. S165]